MAGLGFFAPETTPRRKVITPPSAGEPNCPYCGLHRTCKTPKMAVSGRGLKKCLIIAEAPGEEEDARGVQLIGKAGELLRKKLAERGCDLDRDFWKINTVNCRPPDNRKPSAHEAECCRPWVLKAIQELKPEFIWLMGTTALETFFGDRVKTEHLSITVLRHHCIPDKNTGAWVMPLFHPSFLLHKQDPNLEATFDLDIRWAVSCLRRKPPTFPQFETMVSPLTEINNVAEALKKVLDSSPCNITIDFETTGRKPYREGHKILSIGIGTSISHAFSFPYQYPHWKTHEFKIIKGLFTKILLDHHIRKIAHNIKFENRWSRVILGVSPLGWMWDTMNVQHILDTRRFQTNLKLQAFLRWGQDDYEGDLKKLKKADKGEEFNNLHRASIKKLLIYNGMDCLLEYKLFEDQQREIARQDGPARFYAEVFHEGNLALADMEDEGIPVDEQYYINEDIRLKGILDELEKNLYESREARLFQSSTGKRIGLDSTKDLRHLFFTLLEEQSVKSTPGGGQSVDEETLYRLKSPFAKNLLEYRKYNKIKNTYMAQFMREICNGKIHPFFDLNIAETGRGNSSHPNFQNIPVREEVAKKSVRQGIIPRPGEELLETDYKAIEVRIMACYSLDPELIRYIEDPTTDMHRDQACEIFFLPPDRITKALRHASKNGFVFPEFYGDWFKACARYIWDMIQEEKLADQTPVLTHLRNNGIRRFDDFVSHMQSVESRFWCRFSATKQWRDDTIDLYRRKGFVPTYFGFRRNGYLSNNQICNSPIQGTAFFCLLWSCIRLNEIRKREGWRSVFIGQIHDSLLSSVHPEERDHIIRIIQRVMCEDIRQEHKWIIVPLEVEFSSSGIDGNWASKTEVDVRDVFCGRTRR